MKLPLTLLLLMFSASLAFTQTAPTYTQSTPHSCQFATGYSDVCNGQPLDQGGNWQFIVANQAFTINREAYGFYIYGNPGNPGTGGLTVTNDTITFTSPGELDFTWKAVDLSGNHYSGNAAVLGHYIKGCNYHGCWHTLVVDSAQIWIN